jgi:hypothetical protein
MTAPFNPPQMGEAQIVLHRADGSVVIERFAEVDQYRLMVENFGRAARGEATFPCPLEFSRGNQVAIDTMLAAG